MFEISNVRVLFSMLWFKFLLKKHLTNKSAFSMFKPIILLLQIICYSNTLHSNREKEQAYSDILKNITLANKILQDLINNYERIEKIYQSEELLQMHSTSAENDQTFKSFSLNKPKKKQQERSNRKYTSKPFMGTAMIYESSSNEVVGEESNEEKNKVTNNKRVVQTNFNNYKGKKSHEDFKKRFQILSNKSKIKIGEPNSSVRKTEETSQENSESNESEEVEQIIIDIPNDVSAIVVDTPNERIVKSDSGDKPITNIWGTKTRFSIQHTANKKERTNLTKDNTEMSRDALRSRNNSSEKIIRSKIISTNKIKKNTSIYKPARLRTHREEISQMKNNPNSKNKGKITLLILTNNKKAKYDWIKRSKGTKIKNKQLFPNIDSQKFILRSEYGDTCLQMPIKKCKKALKNVNKNICKRRFKCKSDFKSDFIQNSKDGCNEEFAYKGNHAEKPAENETNSDKYEKFSPPEFRKLKKKSLKNDGRKKKNSVKALPEKKLQKLDHFISLRNETPLSALLRVKRDKYEKKCQKESLIKCNNACNYALQETCSTHTCDKRKKKAIKSECKTQCKIAFKDTKKRVKSSSTSDGESDSDSESHSDNESESDDESENDVESESDSE